MFIFERWRESARNMKDPRAMIVTALLIALNVVLDRFFTIMIGQTMRLNLSFLTLAITAALYGPVVAMYAGALTDIVAYVSFPKGAFFIGFTLSAVLMGLIYAMFLYKTKLSWWRAALAQASVLALISLGLNMVWLSFLFKQSAIVLFMDRLVTRSLVFPIEAVLLFIMVGASYKIIERLQMRTSL